MRIPSAPSRPRLFVRARASARAAITGGGVAQRGRIGWWTDAPLASAQFYRGGMRSFLYLHAPDVAAARDFYRGIVGLSEIFAADDGGTVGFVAGELQLTVARHDGSTSPGGWPSQLGWEGGTGSAPSWGFEVDDDRFAGVVAAARAAGVASRWSDPRWVGYWSFPVRDPMGNTVELSATARGAWPCGTADG